MPHKCEHTVLSHGFFKYNVLNFIMIYYMKHAEQDETNYMMI